MGGYSSFGIQRTLDRAARFVGKGFPTFLRMYSQPQVNTEQFAQFGFQVSASGTQSTNDVLIEPSPLVTDVPLRDLGLNSVILPFGSKKFQISQGFVAAQQQLNNYIEPGTGRPDWYRVFRDPSVQGIYYNSRMFKIVSILPDVIGYNPVWWTITGAFQEQPVIP